jgi:hypothetical protein
MKYHRSVPISVCLNSGVLVFAIRDHPLAARPVVLLAVLLLAAAAFLATFRYRGWLGPLLYTDVALLYGTLLMLALHSRRGHWHVVLFRAGFLRSLSLSLSHASLRRHQRTSL